MKKKNKKVILILIIKWTLILVPQFLLFTIAHWLVIFTIWKYPGVFTFASCFFCCPVHRVVYSRICIFVFFASVNECFTHLQIWIFRKKNQFGTDIITKRSFYLPTNTERYHRQYYSDLCGHCKEPILKEAATLQFAFESTMYISVFINMDVAMLTQ